MRATIAFAQLIEVGRLRTSPMTGMPDTTDSTDTPDSPPDSAVRLMGRYWLVTAVRP